MALLLVTALAVLLELGLRWARPLQAELPLEYRVPHPQLGWSLIPNARYVNRMAEEAVPVRYNAGGWRDFPRSEERVEGVVRVLMLGDSFMEAYSVRLEDSVAARLERLTNTANRPVEVINLGVGGYGTLQEYLVFDIIGRAYRPDVVVLAMFLRNDLQNNSRTLETRTSGGLKADTRPFLEPQARGDADEDLEWQITQVDFEGALRRYEDYQRRRAEPLNRLLRNSALLQSGQRALARLRGSEDRATDQEIHFTDYRDDEGVFYCDQTPEYTQSWDVTRRILARLDREVRAAGGRLLVMSVPSIEEVNEDATAQFLRSVPNPKQLCIEQAFANRHLGEVLAELDIDYLDLLPAFRDARRQSGAELFRRSDRHWNPQGHALAAEALAATLEGSDYLGSRGAPKQ